MSRAYNVTTSEISALFFGIGIILSFFVIKDLFGMFAQVQVGNPGLAMQFIFLISLIGISIFFNLISMGLPNHVISKYNLTILIDKITNPDYMGWARVTRNKRLTFQTVKCAPLGQTKGMAYDMKADVINDGTYTITTPCGNPMIVVSDLLSTNINLENAVGWNLIKKHYGVFGYNAWEKCAEDRETLLPLISVKEEKHGEQKETIQIEKRG